MVFEFTPRKTVFLIILAAFLVYLPHLGNEFVSLDDGLLITKNPASQELTWRSVSYVFSSYDPELYIPVTFLTYQIEHAMYGLSSWGFHFTNLVLHTASAVLLHFLIRKLTRREWVSLGVALLFALHPIQTEAVAWAAARKDVLSSFLALSSLLMFLKYKEDEHSSQYWGSVILFALALMAKVSVIVLPLFIPLLAWQEGRTFDRKLVRTLVPYLVLCVIFGIVAVIGKTNVIEASGPTITILLAAKSTVFYVSKLLLPLQLSVIYPQSTPVTFASVEFLAVLAAVLALVAVTAVLLWKKKPTGTLLAAFLLLLFPNETNFVKNGFIFFASDRYVYLAVIPLFLLFVLALEKLTHVSTLMKRVVPIVFGVLLVLLGTKASLQASTWKNSEALYKNVVAFYPTAALAWNNLGAVLYQQKRTEEAVQMFTEALKQDNTLMTAHLNMGTYHRDQGRTDDAIKEFQIAIDLMKNKDTLLLDQVGPYYYLADYLDTLGRTDEAIKVYQDAFAKVPDAAEPHYNLGITYQRRGRGTEAKEQFLKAVELEPRYADAWYHLAGIQAETGDLPAAKVSLEKTLELQPLHAKAREHLENIERLLSGQK